jgi:hypothetical protein
MSIIMTCFSTTKKVAIKILEKLSLNSQKQLIFTILSLSRISFNIVDGASIIDSRTAFNM